jgi:O-6-methylguanine DNA methyltransferase
MIVTPFRTRLGWVAILADNHALLGLTLPRSTRHAAVTELRTEFNCHPTQGETALTKRAREMLVRYFEGQRIAFDDLPVEQAGTVFQQRVWQLTRAIPYGATRTYRELASAAGRPNAARAIGQCMARNRLPIIIPCHRLVGSQGDLRGFGGGIPMKRTLLEMEGARSAHRH